MKNEKDEIKDEINPIDILIEKLNDCRKDYYKLYEKDFKVASIRLRHNLEYIIQNARQIKKDALLYRKDIENRERLAKEEAKNEGIL